MGSSDLDLCCFGDTVDADVQLPLAHYRQDHDMEDTTNTSAVPGSIT